MVVANKSKTLENATKFIMQLTKSIYTATSNSQIPIEAQILVYPIPEIEGTAQMMARATHQIRGQQGSAWGPVFASNDEMKGRSSRMKNLPSQKQR